MIAQNFEADLKLTLQTVFAGKSDEHCTPTND
jgi:hypothetical protein